MNDLPICNIAEKEITVFAWAANQPTKYFHDQKELLAGDLDRLVDSGVLVNVIPHFAYTSFHSNEENTKARDDAYARKYVWRKND